MENKKFTTIYEGRLIKHAFGNGRLTAFVELDTDTMRVYKDTRTIKTYEHLTMSEYGDALEEIANAAAQLDTFDDQLEKTLNVLNNGWEGKQ